MMGLSSAGAPVRGPLDLPCLRDAAALGVQLIWLGMSMATCRETAKSLQVTGASFMWKHIRQS